MGRSPCCDKAKVRKGPWSAHEDALLLNFVTNFGNGGNWISLPKKVGLNRCGKSCRLRWLNYLRPDIKHGDFTEEEDYIIYTLYNTIGSRWSTIAANLQGRTDNDVKNYWNTKLKKKILSGKFQNNDDIFPTINTTTNTNYGTSAESAYMNTNCSTLIMSRQILDGNEEIVTILNNENDVFINMEGGGDDFKQAQGYSSSRNSSSVTSEISSYSLSSRSSSFMDIISSGSSASIPSNSEEDEFWMDLLSDSMDDVVVGSQLDQKISEMASLLGIDYSSSC